MDCEDGSLSLHGATVSVGGATGTLVMVEGGGVALQMHDDSILQNMDGVKLEPINIGGLSGLEAGTSSDGLVGMTAQDGELTQQGVLTDPALGEGLPEGAEVSFPGEQYIINPGGEVPEGYVGIDSSMLSQAYVPVMMNMDSHDMAGGMLAAQIVDNSAVGGQRVIILAPGTSLHNGGLQQVGMVEPQEDGGEGEHEAEVIAQPVDLSVDTGQHLEGGVGEVCEELTEGVAKAEEEDEQEEVLDEDFQPATKKIKLEEEEDADIPLIVLTVPEDGEEVMEGTTEEVVSNVKFTTEVNGSKSPKINYVAAETDVTQAWFTTKDDKVALQSKGHQWKQGQWTKEEIEVLEHNIALYCKAHTIVDPAEVIFHFTKEERKDFYRTVARGLQRPLFSVYRRVIRMYDQKNHIGKYTPDEIIKLKELRVKHGSDWATIGAALGRSASSVKDRCRLMRDTCNSGKWLPDEEHHLTQAVYDLSGCTPGESVTKGLSWAAVAERVRTRSEKQCRTKWLNYLNWKQLGGTEWTREDDILLINKLAAAEVTDETQVDWNELSENWPSARSPQWLRGKWWTLKRHVPDYTNTQLHELLEMLKKTHYPKTQVKATTVIQPQSHMNLQQLGVNMTIIPVSTPDGLAPVAPTSSLGVDVATSQGIGIYPSVITSQPQGAFLITQGQNNSAISLTGTSMTTDHIIVHTLPITQDGVLQSADSVSGVPLSPPQPVIVAPTEGTIATGLTATAESTGPSYTPDTDLAGLVQSAEIVESPVPEITQDHLEIQSHLDTGGEIIHQEHDLVHLESQMSVAEMSGDVAAGDLEIHVALPGTVSSTAQFEPVQATSNDLIENMSSLSDPMLPSESVDLIGSCSDTEGEKAQDANS